MLLIWWGASSGMLLWIGFAEDMVNGMVSIFGDKLIGCMLATGSVLLLNLVISSSRPITCASVDVIKGLVCYVAQDQMVSPFMQSISGQQLNDQETQQQVQLQLSSLYDFFKQLYSQDRKEIR